MSEQTMVETKFNEDVGQVEKPRVDVSEFNGVQVEIAKVLEMDGKYGECVKVISKPLMVLDNEKKTEICASEIFSLTRDDAGKLGWTEESKLGKFLKKYKKDSYRDLIGVKVVSIVEAKNGVDFLTIA